MTETKPTAGPWMGVAHTGYIYGEDTVVAVVGGFLTDKDLIQFNGERWTDDTKLIVTAVNACFKVNPSNPMAVAEGIEEAFRLLKELTDLAMPDTPAGGPVERTRALLTKIGLKNG